MRALAFILAVLSLAVAGHGGLVWDEVESIEAACVDAQAEVVVVGSPRARQLGVVARGHPLVLRFEHGNETHEVPWYEDTLVDAQRERLLYRVKFPPGEPTAVRTVPELYASLRFGKMLVYGGGAGFLVFAGLGVFLLRRRR